MAAVQLPWQRHQRALQARGPYQLPHPQHLLQGPLAAAAAAEAGGWCPLRLLGPYQLLHPQYLLQGPLAAAAVQAGG
jgi:hypothetical protein